MDTSPLRPSAVRAGHLHPLQRLVHDYEWVHIAVGIMGNLLFLVGSVLFLWDSTKLTGVWLFIIGAGFMLVGAIGSAIVRLGPVQERVESDT